MNKGQACLYLSSAAYNVPTLLKSPLYYLESFVEQTFEKQRIYKTFGNRYDLTQRARRAKHRRETAHRLCESASSIVKVRGHYLLHMRQSKALLIKFIAQRVIEI